MVQSLYWVDILIATEVHPIAAIAFFAVFVADTIVFNFLFTHLNNQF